MANSIGVNNPVHLAWFVFCKTYKELEKGDLWSVFFDPKSSCRQLSNRTPELPSYLVLRHALIRLCSLMQLPRVRLQTTPGSRQNPENSASNPRAPLMCKDFPQGETRTGSSTSIEEVEGQCAAVLTQSYTHTHNSQQFPCVGKSENLNIN